MFIRNDMSLFKTQVGQYKEYLGYLNDRAKGKQDLVKEEEFVNNPKKWNLNVDSLQSLKFQAKVYFAPKESKKEDDVVDM